MKLIDHWIGKIAGAASVLASVALILMMIQISVDVIGRYVLNIPVPATIAIVSNYYMVVVTFIPLALAERHNSHISMELVTDLMPQRLQNNVYGWGYLFSAVTFFYLAYAGYQEALNKSNILAFIIERGVRIPVWPAYWVLPIGAVLVAVVLLCRFAVYITGTDKRDDDQPVDDAVKTDVEGHL